MKRLLLLALLGCVTTASAAPQLMRLQGRFTDPRRGSLTDTLPVRFTVFDDQYYGRPLWQEIQTVPVNDSAFQVVLGRINPLPSFVFDGQNRWLEMQLGDNPPLRPRHRIPANYGSGVAAMPLASAPPPPPVVTQAPVVQVTPVQDAASLESHIDQYVAQVPPPPPPAVAPVVVPPPTPKPVAVRPPKPTPVTAVSVEMGPVYEVKAGDTLRSIAKKLYGNPERWYDLYNLNQDRLGPMGYVSPGQILVLPKEKS